MSVEKIFDKYAASYDASRKKLIPCFDDFYRVALDIVPFGKDAPIRVLDLGAGTGLMAEKVAEGFPGSFIVLLDISADMLAVARERLGRYPNGFDFVVSDYAQPGSIQGNYDLVISSLSIHHLTADEKRTLFKNIAAHLNPGGCFINADQVLGETPDIEASYKAFWERQIREAGATDEEISGAHERMKEDDMSTLSSQLQWLKDAGFNTVNCWYQNFSFAVFSGVKPSESLAGREPSLRRPLRGTRF